MKTSSEEMLDTKMGIAMAYTVFAVLAMAVNILVQEISLFVYGLSYALYVSILAGTLAGLLVKYILDKRYIFNYQPYSTFDNGRTFLLYSLMGAGTTIVFWGFELSFDYVFESKVMRYTGAVIGLTVGYYLKYHLDKRFVFNS